jgi:hypothetical protein
MSAGHRAAKGQTLQNMAQAWYFSRTSLFAFSPFTFPLFALWRWFVNGMKADCEDNTYISLRSPNSKFTRASKQYLRLGAEYLELPRCVKERQIRHSHRAHGLALGSNKARPAFARALKKPKRGAEDQPVPPNKGTIAEHKRQARQLLAWPKEP